MASTLTEYLDSQHELEKEAALALPFSFSHCTHSRGHIRQAVYLCITCASQRGICSSCSIACHTDHEQLELFPKRNFRCDCPTSALTHPCLLHKRLEAPNEENRYSQNFEAKFCRCGRPYDANSERETMIQCLACEDWFHESCLNLRTCPSSRSPPPEILEEENAGAQDDDSRSEVSSSGLPPPLITAGDYDALVCRSCVSNISILQAWAGTPGIAMVVRDGPDSQWKIIGFLQDDVVGVDDGPETEGKSPARVEALDPGKKRSLLNSSPSPDGPRGKRMCTSGTSIDFSQKACLAPAPHPFAQAVLAQLDEEMLGAGDIFLSGDWRERWCQCDSCILELRKHPYLLEEEETYEPPEDPDSHLSLEELGLRALERLPRDRALDGIRAFNTMRYAFAQEGREVEEIDVRRFFEARTQVARTA
ncbi:hypothetical protein F5148DRAFT_1229582 [Russula earlei]|uniref:Uncharacterized protein n=1 Tax=Russula earlei TaxID=71964 RepID=A0ACC0TZ51_9AGAM|nr:hypothetical protein F5148DRAFT_1229582 [Russula earlei]